MMSSTLFDISVLIALLGIVFLLGTKKIGDSKKYEISVAFTILAYRALTFIYLTLGGTFGENAFINDRFDHKWLGISLILLVLIFWPRKKWTDYKPVILGLGTGMVIDEISEILALFGVNFSPTFRDSLPDLFLIAAFFIAFIVVRRSIEKAKLKW